MINAQINSNGGDNGGAAIPAYKLGGTGAGIPPAQDKQQPAAIKKTALRDLQNQYGGLARNHQETLSFLGGGLSTDSVKVCGNKRLTPERPPNSTFYPALNNSCANEQIINARRRFELELGRGSIQSKLNKSFEYPPQTRQLQLESPPKKRAHPRTSNNYVEPVATPNTVVPAMSNSFLCGPPVPNFLGKYGPGTQAAHTDSLKVTLEYPSYANLKPSDEEQRTERFIRLQKFLKECDESNCRDYVQRLQHLSPAELSRHAVELEKRAIQLTKEEGKEMQRMKTLHVLTNNPNQLLHSRK